jgi:hypothetical protein
MEGQIASNYIKLAEIYLREPTTDYLKDSIHYL